MIGVFMISPNAYIYTLKDKESVSHRARKRVTIHGETPRDWSLLGSKRDNWGLDTRIIHNKIFYGICILYCCTLWFR